MSYCKYCGHEKHKPGKCKHVNVWYVAAAVVVAVAAAAAAVVVAVVAAVVVANILELGRCKCNCSTARKEEK